MEKHSAATKKAPSVYCAQSLLFQIISSYAIAKALVKWLQKAHNKVNNSLSHCQRSSKLKVSLWEKLKTNKLEK